MPKLKNYFIVFLVLIMFLSSSFVYADSSSVIGLSTIDDIVRVTSRDFFNANPTLFSTLDFENYNYLLSLRRVFIQNESVYNVNYMLVRYDKSSSLRFVPSGDVTYKLFAYDDKGVQTPVYHRGSHRDSSVSLLYNLITGEFVSGGVLSTDWTVVNSYTPISSSGVIYEYEDYKNFYGVPGVGEAPYNLSGIKDSIVFSTSKIYDESGSVELFPEVVLSDYEANIVFTLPPYGFIHNSVIQSYWTMTSIETDSEFDSSKLEFNVLLNGQRPSVQGLRYEVTHHSVDHRDGKYWNWLNYWVEVPVGVSTMTLEAVYDGEVIGSETIETERLAGFVDADGDGLDDRTGREDNSQPLPPLYGNKPPSFDLGNLKNNFEFFTTGFNSLVNSLFGAMYAVLPREFILLGLSVITVFITIAILKALL